MQQNEMLYLFASCVLSNKGGHSHHVAPEILNKQTKEGNTKVLGVGQNTPSCWTSMTVGNR